MQQQHVVGRLQPIGEEGTGWDVWWRWGGGVMQQQHAGGRLQPSGKGMEGKATVMLLLHVLSPTELLWARGKAEGGRGGGGGSLGVGAGKWGNFPPKC